MLFKIFTVLALLGLASQLSHNKESSAVVTHIPFFVPPPGTSGQYSSNDGSHAEWDKYSGHYSGNDGSHMNWSYR